MMPAHPLTVNEAVKLTMRGRLIRAGRLIAHAIQITRAF